MNYERTMLAKRIATLGIPPKDPAEYAAWVKGEGHLNLLRDNAKEDELAVFAMDKHAIIHTVVVNKDDVYNMDRNTLLYWNGNFSDPIADYGTDQESDFRIFQNDSLWKHESLSNPRRLVFRRKFEGSRDRHYYEIRQEYAHLADIHWRPERHAYCRFDELGDWEDVVTVTQGDDAGLDLVTFKRQQLEHLLIASNSVLVRTFVLDLYPLDHALKWTAEFETVHEDAEFFYRRKIEDGKGGYYQGVQIIPPRPSISLRYWDHFGRTREENEYVKFMAYDFRNGRITNISTNPSATTAHPSPENDLPHTLSPAFFHPDVLSKYKNDPDKYTIQEYSRSIICRGGLTLRSYDVNEAGQISAYICDLQRMPYKEQQHWKIHNEEPKTGISPRAVTSDFEGKFSDITTPLEDLLRIMRRWININVEWWQPREKELIDNIHLPNNRQEWARSLSNLDKLVIEGLKSDAFYTILVNENKAKKVNKKHSLRLAKLVLIHYRLLDDGQELKGLEMVRLIRNKCVAHPRGSTARKLESKALEEHETFSGHFEHICKETIRDLGLIEKAFR